MSNIVPFSFESFNVRVIADDNGELLFVAKDVCESLEYKDPTTAIKSHCKGVQELHPLETAGGTQKVRVIREPDLYRLIAGSTLPSAERFEKWLFEEVLPSIRKTGSYHIDQPKPKRAIVNDEHSRALKLAPHAVRAAKAYGFIGNMATLSADNAVRSATGISLLAMMGATHLLADPRGRSYNPTDLGKMMLSPMSPQKVNKTLEEKGKQVHDIKGDWIPTDAAKGLYEWADTAKRHTDGTPVKQLRWFVGVLDAIGIPYQQIGKQEAA